MGGSECVNVTDCTVQTTKCKTATFITGNWCLYHDNLLLCMWSINRI